MEHFQNEEKQFAFGFDRDVHFGVATMSLTVGGDEKAVPLSVTAIEKDGKTHQITYKDKKNSFLLDSFVEMFEDIDAIRQSAKVRATKPLTLTQVACVCNRICFDPNGIKDRLFDGSILVHYCLSRWQGEAQWRVATPEDLGVYTATKHAWEKSHCRFDSVSSWSTGTYYPLFMIEDKKRSECWFFEIEGGHSWFLEIYGVGGEGIQSLSVKYGSADERLGFAKKMQEGDEYASCHFIYGIVKGGFEEAVHTLTKLKRRTSLVCGGAPLVFNDYMNCNWTNESDKTLLPLIDKAATLGMELFCIDDGWQKQLGVWIPADEKFGDQKLQGIFDAIRSKGMKVGVWFEFESVASSLLEELKADDCLLFRNDGIVAPNRPLANMRSKKLVAYLNERVDALYQMGVRFIKNDHNNTEYIGTTLYGESAAEGLENNYHAFLDFIDGLVERYPDLVIENCASGAMRSDHGTLKHFHIQSTSDQENYWAYPSILSGSLALMPPEKAGIWCYPYALEFDERDQHELTKEQMASYADGEETVFNVVNGFMGGMYVSGKLHQADEYNTLLLKEGFRLYKQERTFIKNSYPVFPHGTIRLSNQTYHAVGLTDEPRKKMLVAVWNLQSDGQEVTVDLKKYALRSCRIFYPSEKKGVSYCYEQGTLKITFEKGKTARLFLFE